MFIVLQVAVGLVQSLAEERKSWDDIAKALRYLCIKLAVEDGPVCKGIIPEFQVSEWRR